MAESCQVNAQALLKGMEDFMTSKTVVGEPVRVGDTILIPLVDVSFGMMTSSKSEPSRHNGGGGMGGKMSPNAVLVIKDGQTRVINIKNQDGLTKIMDFVPEVMNRFMPGNNEKETRAAAREAADNAKEEF